MNGIRVEAMSTNSNSSSEEPTTKTGMWCQWIRYRIRHYMILEAFVAIILVLILSNSYHISTQNEKTYELISNLQTKINQIEKQFESNLVFKTDHSKEKTESKFLKDSDELKNNDVQSVTTVSFVSSNTQNQSPTNNSCFEINAASYIMGATVDTSYSSSSNLSPLIGFDQNEYVLLDRKELPSDRAWCSKDDQPILTVKLAKYIKPTAVSYQHSKWNGTVPNGAPKIYDLMACMDTECQELEILVSKCEYRSSGDNKQEQICSIPSNQNVTSIKKVQFHFRENHGNISNTCVSLVRVYGEMSLQQKTKEKQKEDAETCSELTMHYHNNPIRYNLAHKNCTLLYSKGCCTECPECCLECKIHDINGETIVVGVLISFVFIMFLFVILIIIADCYFHNNK